MSGKGAGASGAHVAAIRAFRQSNILQLQ
eukprot:COSAG03_NODE_26345_length_259_cov_1.943750_1_plen_28_part_10